MENMDNRNTVPATIIREDAGQAGELRHKILYGLPCKNCRSYYESRLSLCPICQCSENMAPESDVKAIPAAF